MPPSSRGGSHSDIYSKGQTLARDLDFRLGVFNSHKRRWITYRNVLATNDFVVNIPSFDREILEKVRTLGVAFAPGVNELEKSRPHGATVEAR